MRSHFADWAAHTAAELDYLTREQVIYHATIFVFIVIYKYVIWIYKYLMLYVKSFKKVDRGYLEVDLAGDWDLFRPSVWTAQVLQLSSSLSLSLLSWLSLYHPDQSHKSTSATIHTMVYQALHFQLIHRWWLLPWCWNSESIRLEHWFKIKIKKLDWTLLVNMTVRHQLGVEFSSFN